MAETEIDEDAPVQASFEHQAINSLRRARRELRSKDDEEARINYNVESAKVLALLELAEAIRSTGKTS